MNLKKAIFILIFFLIGTSSAEAATYENKTQFSKIKLVSPYQTISKQNKKIPIGLWITLEKGWHSYWQYPGESGKALNTKWTLPKGSSVSSFKWPLPERLNVGSFTNFVYKDQYLLISELSLPDKKSDSQIRVTAQVEWFICEEICIPLTQEVHLNLDVREKEEISPHWKNIFDKWSLRIPQTIKKKIKLQTKTTDWQAHISTEKKLQLLDVFPLSKEDFSPKKPTIVSTNNYQHSFLIKPIGAEKNTSLPQNKQQRTAKNTYKKNIQALLIFEDENDKLGFIYTFTYKKESLLWFLFFAFLGGLILNFMPCVLPIVFLKFSNTLELSKQKNLKLF